MKNENTEWLKEYEAFLQSENTAVPSDVSESLFAHMKNLLRPKAKIVFFKILGIHFLVSFMSLAICHQFDMNPFGTEESLSNWMMSVGGHNFCMIGCGVFFISLSFLFAGSFLSIEEVLVLKRTQFIQTSVLGLISLAAFYFFGAEIIFTMASLWLLGAMIGGVLATRTVWALKRIYA